MRGWVIWLVVALSATLYIYLGYFVPREDFTTTLSIFGGLFILALLFPGRVNWKWAFAIAIGFRTLLLFSIPELSDDIWRFLWDGKASLAGLNPYLHLPSDLVDKAWTGLGHDLFDKLNSPDYYTVYPPVAQFIYLIGGIPSDPFIGIIIIKVILLGGEILNLLLIRKLLDRFGMHEYPVLFYAFNPLVIMEVMGNVHFEGLILTSILGAVYLLSNKKFMLSALTLGLGIGVKLIPLFFIPFLFRYLGVKRWLHYSLVAVGTFALTFIPFLSGDFISHISESLELYVKTFEFNASIYYIVREIGYLVKGYNIIVHGSGIILSLISIGIMIFLSSRVKQDLRSVIMYFGLGLTAYYLLATTVHPWYIINLIILALFTPLRFTLMWSFLAVLSYHLYATDPYSENLWIVFAEYLLLAVAIFMDWKRRNYLLTETQSATEPQTKDS